MAKESTGGRNMIPSDEEIRVVMDKLRKDLTADPDNAYKDLLKAMVDRMVERDTEDLIQDAIEKAKFDKNTNILVSKLMEQLVEGAFDDKDAETSETKKKVDSFVRSVTLETYFASLKRWPKEKERRRDRTAERRVQQGKVEPMAKTTTSDFERSFINASDNLALAAKLKSMRQSAGLTQAELAKHMNTSRTNIVRMEKGGDDVNLTLATLRRYAEATGQELELVFRPPTG